MEDRNPNTDEAKALQILTDIALERGSYSNLAMISHAEEEFVIDFLFQIGGRTQLTSRVILSPAHTQRLAEALIANLEIWKKKREDMQASRSEPTKPAAKRRKKKS